MSQLYPLCTIYSLPLRKVAMSVGNNDDYPLFLTHLSDLHFLRDRTSCRFTDLLPDSYNVQCPSNLMTITATR